MEHPLPWIAEEAGPFDPGMWVIHDAQGEMIATPSEDLHAAFDQDTAELIVLAVNTLGGQATQVWRSR